MKKLPIAIAVCAAAGLFVFCAAFFFFHETRGSKLPIRGQVRNFRLFDQNGDEFSLKNLEGKVWIADFFFTTCSDICPLMTKSMAALHRSFELVDGVSLVSITVNPEIDSAAILKTYAQKYRANTDKWHFLTGPRGQIKEMAVKSFKVGSIEDPVFHSAKLILVDRRGLIRGYYDGVQAGEVAKLFKDTAALLKEK